MPHQTPKCPPIQVWRFHEAPEVLQLSDNGGDEDWLALVPAEYALDWIGWLECSGCNGFGVCGVNIYEIDEDGRVFLRSDDGPPRETGTKLPEYANDMVYIGFHA